MIDNDYEEGDKVTWSDEGGRQHTGTVERVWYVTEYWIVPDDPKDEPRIMRSSDLSLT